MKTKILIILLLINHTFLLTSFAIAGEKKCSANDDLACHLEIISRVDIQIRGDLLKKYKNDFLNLTKKSFKNKLSMLSFEKRAPEFLDYTSCDHVEMKKRGSLYCSIITTGRHATAFHVTIELYGFGHFEQELDNICITPPTPHSQNYYPFNKNFFKGEILGVTKYNEAREKVENSIKKIIKQISVQLLEARDRK